MTVVVKINLDKFITKIVLGVLKYSLSLIYVTKSPFVLPHSGCEHLILRKMGREEYEESSAYFK